MTPARRRPDLSAADMIRELTHPWTTTQPAAGGVWVPVPTTLPPPYRRAGNGWQPDTHQDRVHTVHHPALLDQIDQTLTGRTGGEEVFNAAYGSKPAGRIECLALIQRIGDQSHQLAASLGLPRLPLRDRLSRLAGALPDQHPVVRSWWLTARVLTRHDGPPFSPDVPCPVETCERRGSLRIRPDQRIAVCVECGTVWDDADTTPNQWFFGRLVLWVEWAAEHLQGARHWLTDDDGYPVECTHCLGEREAMAVRSGARATSGRGGRVRHAEAS